jgi:hypothetical protein
MGNPTSLLTTAIPHSKVISNKMNVEKCEGNENEHFEEMIITEHIILL